jgi:hypothetical protein
MLAHNEKRGGAYPCGMNEYKQAWDAWLNKGIGTATSYKDTTNPLKSSKCYFMSFKDQGRIVGHSASAGVIGTMVFVGDGGWSNKISFNDFYYSAGGFGLRMSNYGEIRKMMCNNNDNCFASPNIGFSTHDKDRDSYGSHCSNSYGGVGWWQAHCHHHHQHKSGISQSEYAGCQGTGTGQCSTQHWTWYVK